VSAKDYLATLRTSPRVRKYLRRALIALLSTYAAYLLLANVFLGFHLLDRVVTSDDGTVELRTGRAYSFIPGRASVRDFVLRLDNENMQVRLTVARATTSVNLFKLLSREIKLSGVEASGVSFRIRMRVDAIRPDNAERVAAFPDIEGALGPPLLSAAIPVPENPVEKAWHVDLVDAVVHADEVWIQEYRVTGDVSAAGGFMLWPGKDFMLRPSTFHVGAGMVRVGPRIVTNDMKIRTGTADIAKLSLPDTLGPDILRYLTASASGSSTLQDASFLEVYPSAGIPQIRVEPSRSTFLARFAGGKFLEGTTATVDVPQGSARVEGSFVVSGAVHGRIAVPKDGEIEIGADSALTQLELSYLPSTKAAPFSAHNTSFRQTLQVAVGEPLRAGVGAYRSELRTPTLGWMEDLAKGGLKTRGRGVGTIDLTRDASGAITGSFTARLEEATLTTKDLTANVSSVTRGGVVTKSKPEEGVTVTRVTVEAPRASVQADGRPPHTTWFRADIPSVTVTLSPRTEVRASADLSAGDGGLVAGIVESQIGVVLGPVAAHFLEGPPGMSVRAGLATLERDITLEVPRARVGKVESKGFFVRRGGKMRLAVMLLNAPFVVGLRIDDGVPTVAPAVGLDWLDAQRM